MPAIVSTVELLAHTHEPTREARPAPDGKARKNVPPVPSLSHRAGLSFSPGDVVTCFYVPFAMTITQIAGDAYECVWKDDGGARHAGIFREIDLRGC